MEVMFALPGGLLKLKYVTGYVMTQQVAAVWTSGWCVRQKENVFFESRLFKK